MQQLNVHDYYDIGKTISNLEAEIAKIEEAPLSSISWALFMVRWRLNGVLSDPCALLPATQRAARALMEAITGLIPEDVQAAFSIDKSEMVYSWQLGNISSAITNFETVLKNDMPEMSTFAVAQIGMYRTEDLINRPYVQIDESVRLLLVPLAKADITEAGKCLAFRVPTAAAFHLSRAIETGMNQYYEALTGHSFNLKDASRNWAVKTQALQDAGAINKITEFLIHIRKAYRNPITHPDVILGPDEAFNFFPQAIGVISMMLGAVNTLAANDGPALRGLAEGMESVYGTTASGMFDAVRPGDEKDPLGLEAGATAETGSGKEG